MNGQIVPFPHRLLPSINSITDHIISYLPEFVELLWSFLFPFHPFPMSFTNCILYPSIFLSVPFKSSCFAGVINSFLSLPFSLFLYLKKKKKE